ncbi:MAG: HlyD family efflux transporter periplasmic adaptor subunit [Gemmatimonadales bacterium]
MKGLARIIVPILLIGSLLVWYFIRGTGGSGGAVVASGTVEATEAHLGFQIPGRIAEIRVQEGARVLRGDTLALLELSDQEAARRSAAAALDAARAQLAELETGSRPQEVRQAEAAVRAADETLTDARRELERTQRLYEGGAASRQSLDRAQTAFDVAAASADQKREQLALVREGPRLERLEAQRALVAQAEATLKRAEAVLDYGVVVAPHPGMITIRHREPGEIVSAGAPVLTLMNPDDRWVRIYVRADRVGRLSIGQTATITADAYPERTYTGRVVFIASEAEFTPRDVQTTEERVKLVYRVKVQIEGDSSFDLKPGLAADVRLETDAG